jgi:hypothetical protein
MRRAGGSTYEVLDRPGFGVELDDALVQAHAL